MIRKLRQCSVSFDFMDPMAELKGKEIKRDTLNELVDYISTSRGVLTENMYSEIIKMVSNIINTYAFNMIILLYEGHPESKVTRAV